MAIQGSVPSGDDRAAGTLTPSLAMTADGESEAMDRKPPYSPSPGIACESQAKAPMRLANSV